MLFMVTNHYRQSCVVRGMRTTVSFTFLSTPFTQCILKIDQRKNLASILRDGLRARYFDMCDRQFLEPCHARKRYRHATSIRPLEQKKGLLCSCGNSFGHLFDATSLTR